MQALWPLLVLVCPLAMGLMMVFMMRGMHHRPDRAESEHGLIEEVDRDTYLTCIAQASQELGDASSEPLPLHGRGSGR